jgi:restriction endonuclease Mrr
MPVPGPSSAAHHTLDNFPLDAAPQQAVVLITAICLSEGWFNEASIAREKAEQWESGYLTILRRELSSANRQSRPTRFVFNSSSTDMIQGACFIEPLDSPDIVTAKQSRLNYLVHLGWLHDLDPTDFEVACRGILRLMGASDARVTRQSGDQGIDFFGKLHLEGRLERAYVLGSLDKNLSIWLVGQAKRYKSVKVATPDLRELVGSVQLARTSTYAGTGGGLEDLKIRPCDPVFYLFFTTGTISRDGWELLEKTGVIALDGEMVAAFLADNDVAAIDGKPSEDEFSSWIDGHRHQ